MAIFKPKRIILVFKFEYTSLLKIKVKNHAGKGAKMVAN